MTANKPTAKRNTKVPSNDWRAEALEAVRKLILAADADIVEEIKWRKPSNNMAGIPVWSAGGILCTGETYKDYIKLTFAHGAALPDPDSLFNASLTGGTRRAIDIHEGELPNRAAFTRLIRAAVAHNRNKGKPSSAGSMKKKPVATEGTRTKGPKKKPVRPAQKATAADGTVLLSGGNPQIPKGYGDAPVQAYIAALDGWKRAACEQLDAIITKTVPRVLKGVKWNSPMYAAKEGEWFISYHCMTRYVKVAFFRGASLRPVPPVTSKHPEVRYLHVSEEDPLDEKQFAAWVKQASRLPGEKM